MSGKTNEKFEWLNLYIKNIINLLSLKKKNTKAIHIELIKNINYQYSVRVPRLNLFKIRLYNIFILDKTT
jgi:hypothetical protein